MEQKHIRIASGQGFWGDLQTAPLDQVSKGPIDYLMMDFLAEVTMSIMQKQKKRNPELGYAKDLVPIIEHVLPICVEKNIKIITNGGGVNPEGCRDAIFRCARKKGIKGLRIGTVLGDDILERIDEFGKRGIRLNNLETGEAIENIDRKILSANVYFG
ncbi:MAG: acyclic terpene utilization AtuA family protein, partial [Bacteroidota bacterium]